MSNYKGVALRLSILCVLLVAMLSLVPQVQAAVCGSACLACKHQCFLQEQQCIRNRLEGCSEIFVDCSNSCMGL